MEVDLRKSRPIRYAAALVVYWAIWGPMVAFAIPFNILGMLTDYLADKMFPRIADLVHPAWSAAHGLAVSAGNRVLGYRPDAP